MSDVFSKYAARPDSFVVFDAAEIEGSIGARFERIVVQYPDKLAYEDDSGLRMTYAELNAAVNVVANHLLDRGPVEPNTTVLLLFGFNARALIASLALLKVGWVAVALDDAYPAARLAYMIADSQAQILLTENAHYGMAESLGLASHLIINIDEVLAQSDEDGNPGLIIQPDTYSHIMYSSGSTGEPKGIIQTHQMILHLACYLTERYGYSPEDRLPLISALSYGNSLKQVYVMLLNGGTLLPYNIRARGLQDMAAWAKTYEITAFSSNSTTIRRFCQGLRPGESLPLIRMVASGGEATRVSDIQLVRRWMPEAQYGINYGTTEALWVVACFVRDLSRVTPDTRIPVGYPFGAHEVMLVDGDRQPVPAGEVGEYAVRSKYLSPGYWGKPELTEAVFRQDANHDGLRLYLSGDVGERTEDNLYYHYGRQDQQIKVRGYRVEPGDAETALVSITGVKEAVVIGQADPDGDMRLIAYVVAEADMVLLDDHLRQAMSQIVPDFLIPARFVYVDELPRTISGKVDKKSLPEPTSARPDLSTPYAAPRDEIESRITAIWAAEIGLDRVGIHDDFFALGGHSLLAARLISEIADQLGLTLSYEALFDAPTPAEMAGIARELLQDGRGEYIARIDTQERDSHRRSPHDIYGPDDDGSAPTASDSGSSGR